MHAKSLGYLTHLGAIGKLIEGIEYCALFRAESQRLGKQLSHWARAGWMDHKRGDGFPGNGTAGSKTRLIAEYLCGVIVQLLHRPYTISKSGANKL